MAKYPQSSRWCFTLNNYTVDECQAINELDVKYMIYGREVGLTGTPHLQGFIIFSGSKRLSTLKKLIPRAHLEIAKGTTEQNITYCTKDQEVSEYGTRPKTPADKGQMEKDRWTKIIAHAKAGTLEEHDPKVYYNTLSTAHKLQAMYEKPIAIKREVKAYYGKTGSGKTYTSWEEAGPDAYVKDPRSKFWYGYSGQENVIIDEFRGGIDIAHMLRWLDEYPVLVEVKHSSCVLKARKIWITSNIHPRVWYPEVDEETIQALLRRIKVTQFHGNLVCTKE